MYDGELCAIENNNSIVSKFCNKDSRIQFGADSFSFTNDDGCIVIRLHPMFMWRLIHLAKTNKNLENEINFPRMRTFASYYTKNVLRINVEITQINYIVTGNTVRIIETDKYYEPLLLAYKSLYRDIMRKCDTAINTDKILDECLTILMFIAKSVL
mgnify:CR=1 FL=1